MMAGISARAHRSAVALWLLLGSFSVLAEVVVVVPSPDEEPAEATLTWSMRGSAVDASNKGGPKGQLSVATPWTGTLDLETTESWVLTAQADGFWSPRLAMPPETRWIKIPWFPAVEITGRLRRSRHEDGLAARSMEVRGWVVRDDKKARQDAQSHPPWQRTACSLTTDELSCIAPRDTRSLKISVEGFVPIYRWDLAELEETLDLGRLELRRGSSISGWVDGEGVEEAKESIQLTLIPRTIGWQGDVAERQRSRLRTTTGHANRDGFFSIGPVPPGGYDLEVSAPGLSRHRVEALDLTAGAETVLDEAIELTPPVGLDVYISPPVDPDQQPWSVLLMRPHSNSNVLDTVERSAAAFDGHWHLDGVSSGPYRIEIRDHQEAVWLVRNVELAVPRAPLFYEVDAVAVQGTLTFADEPSNGVVIFGTRFGRPSADLRVVDGSFEGVLPRDGEWKVEVDINGHGSILAPPVMIERNAGGSATKLKIELPDTLVEGEVLQGEEKVPRAFVHIFSKDKSGEKEHLRLARVRTNDDGVFRVRGLEPGRAQVAAYLGAFDPVSDWVEIDLAEDRPMPYLKLELLDKTTFRGKVQSRQGPVVGAQVFVQPQLTSAMDWPAQAVSDVHGEISLRLSPQSRGVAVFMTVAAGYAFSIHQGTLDESQEVIIPLSVDKGDLTLKYPGGSLFFNGIPVAVSTILAKLVTANRALHSPENGVVLKGMEAGEYSQCPGSVQSANCVSGILTPSSELLLEITDLDEARQ